MKISEIKERKVIHRPTRYFDESGQRIYHAYEYHLPYNPGYKGNETERLFAKWIDMLPFGLIFYFLLHKVIVISILLSIPCVIIAGTITEWSWGTTLGKKIFKIKVLDDYGNYPGFLKSFQRNLLCLANFSPVFSEHTTRTIAMGRRTGTRVNFSMHMNNTICKTYIVKESKIPEIRDLLKYQGDQNLLL
ncbi:RDD family protein [Chryseobacterium sp. PTM-20240506]|uniref:RDD family protein n=1 Tax=unclassified Chryseobacterium TaxID=2593645 RepID=UPI002358E12B|nr:MULTISPECIES: RDD family protein [unclassified Chryseobacterium]MDC8104329.1 RDD family protein [Chryseobacterium sp. B21-037]MDQ1803939.1 RDD family protein [Chryseobacterium sp. CKR4-1]